MPNFRVFDDVTILDPANIAPAGWTVGNFAAAVDAARTNARPLQIRPGTYDAANVDILPTNGGGRPLRIFGNQGTVTIRFTGGNYCIQVRDVDNVSFSGIGFSGQNLAIPAYTAPGATTTTAAGLVIFNNAKNLIVENCTFVDTLKATGEPTNSYKAQLIVCRASTGNIENNTFANGDLAIWNFQSVVRKINNKIQGFQSNGLLIFDVANGGNLSMIENNIINGISAPFGDGQTGNCIAVFRANNVTASKNTLLNCRTGVRFNASSRALVTSNIIYNAREVGIFAEAPGAGQDLFGAIITDNSIDFSGSGINVGNSGFFGDGVARLSIIKGNLITNLVRNTFPPLPGVPGATTPAMAISVEQDSVVEGNMIENCTLGIKLGVAQAARDLNCDGNVIRNCPAAVVFSSNAAASNIVISNNIIRNAPTGAIISTPALDAAPVTASFNANIATQTAGTGGTVLIEGNRAA